MTQRSTLRPALFGATLVVNLVLLYWPRTAGPAGVPGLDKVVHVVTFASLAWTGLRVGLGPRWWVPLLCAHAVTSEVVQAVFLPHRSGDVLDAVADLVGVLLGSVAADASWWRGRRGAVDDPRRSTAGGNPGAG